MDSVVGVIIVNYNTFEETVSCIDSIRQHTSSEYKIYLVDNGSKPEVYEKIHIEFGGSSDVCVIRSSENMGYSGGNNLGANKAISDGCEYLVIANNDIEFRNDVIGILKNDINEEVAISGPAITNLDNKDGQQLIKTYSLGAALIDRVPFIYINRLLGIYKIDARKLTKKTLFYGMVQGSCFIVRADVFKEIGLFDDNVFLYSEERILSIKLKNNGYKTCYNPAAKILHKEGQSTKKTGNAFADYHRYISDYYTVVRYCDGLKIVKRLIKQMRLFSYRVKQSRHIEYKEYLPILIDRMNKIEKGDYRIPYKY